MDKPEGPTSHDVVAVARRALRTRRVGHTGTLDPFASGLLLLCVGPATRLSPFLTHLPKAYDAEALLGVETDTLDREGTVVSETPGAADVPDAAIEAALSGLRGRTLQRPPVFSAKKVRGEAAHRRVRRGEAVELEPVPVEITALRVTGRDGAHLRFRIECSSGTYVRAVARDLGEALGVGAHLTGLRRLSVGPFPVEGAAPFDALVGPDLPWIDPVDALRRLGFPEVAVDAAGRAALGQGRRVPAPASADVAPGRPVAAVFGTELVAVGEVADGLFQPRRVFTGN